MKKFSLKFSHQAFKIKFSNKKKQEAHQQIEFSHYLSSHKWASRFAHSPKRRLLTHKSGAKQSPRNFHSRNKKKKGTHLSKRVQSLFCSNATLRLPRVFYVATYFASIKRKSFHFLPCIKTFIWRKNLQWVEAEREREKERWRKRERERGREKKRENF